MPGVLGFDDLVDPGGGPLDLAGLVGHHVVVVLLPGQLDRGVALADLELVGGFGRARAQAFEQRLHRRRHDEHEQRLLDPLLDLLRALDVDLQDDVATLGQRAADLVARRPVPVVVDLVGLEELASLAERLEPLDDR